VVGKQGNNGLGAQEGMGRMQMSVGNANYSSPQCQLEITSGPALVWVDVVGFAAPFGATESWEP
jgi:hypothetical protein